MTVTFSALTSLEGLSEAFGSPCHHSNPELDHPSITDSFYPKSICWLWYTSVLPCSSVEYTRLEYKFQYLLWFPPLSIPVFLTILSLEPYCSSLPYGWIVQVSTSGLSFGLSWSGASSPLLLTIKILTNHQVHDLRSTSVTSMKLYFFCSHKHTF